MTPNSCGTSTASSVNVTVNPLPVINSIVSNCTGTNLNSVTVQASIVSGTLEYSSNNGGTYQPNGIFTGLLADVNYIFAVRTVGSICTATQNYTPSCINPAVSNNTISTAQVVCSGSTPSTITGNVPNITPSVPFTYQWQSCPVGGSTWSNLTTAQNYSPGALTVSTDYRRLVQIIGFPDYISNIITITVNPLPGTPSIPAGTLTRCQGTSISTFTSSAIDATTYNWTVSGIGNTISGTGPTATVNWSPTFVGTATITVTATNSCGTSAASSVNVIVNPLPVINYIVSNCTGTSLNSVTVQASIVSGTLEYSSDNSSTFQPNATFTGLLAGVNYIFAVRPVGSICTATQNYTPSCSSPTVSNNTISASQVICSGSTPSTITGNVPNITPSVPFTYQWQSCPVGGSTWSNLTTTQNYSPSPLTVSTNYRRLVKIIGYPSDTSNIITITVNPKPTMTNSESITICSNDVVNLALTSDVASTYIWAAIDNANVTGESTTPQSGITITDVLENTSATAQTLTYTVIPTSSVGACTGTTQIVSITVNPKPDIYDMNVNICSDDTFKITPTRINDGIVPPGTTYTWGTPTIAPDNSLIGANAQDNVGLSSVIQKLTNTTNAIATATYTITPKSGDCAGKPFTLTVIVNPTPDVLTLPYSDTICNGATSYINLTTSITGTEVNYSWTAAIQSGNVTGFSNGSGNTIAQTLINAGTAPAIVRYTFTPNIGVCFGTPNIVDITVNPSPKLTIDSNNKSLTICEFDSVELTASNSSRYKWNTGSTTQSITVNKSGIYTVTATNEYGCQATSSVQVTASEAAKCEISLDDITAQTGETITVSVKLDKAEHLFDNGKNQPFTANVSYYSNVLLFEGNDIISSNFDKQTKYNTIQIKALANEGTKEIIQLKFKVNLGEIAHSEILVDAVKWQEHPCATTDTAKAKLTISNICYENGARLISAGSPIEIQSISPNPANDNIVINYSIIEKGATELILVNTLGEAVRTISINTNTPLGPRLETISLDNISQGQYQVILKTGHLFFLGIFSYLCSLFLIYRLFLVVKYDRIRFIA